MTWAELACSPMRCHFLLICSQATVRIFSEGCSLNVIQCRPAQSGLVHLASQLHCCDVIHVLESEAYLSRHSFARFTEEKNREEGFDQSHFFGG
jgi:hypothetical protein